MKQQGHFLLMERSEFRDWLQKQTITRSISKLQVHHTASPNYTTRKKSNGIAHQDAFACLEGMRNYHVNTNKWRATGQNITIMEDGRIAISLDRDLNQTPAGIVNQNSGWICMEIIGNFDAHHDVMTAEQQRSVVHVYACLCDKLSIPIDTHHIAYHAWFTSSGIRLPDYTPGLSAKTCPGTSFWGHGNTVAAANQGFIPAIRQELERLQHNETVEQPMTADEKQAFDELKKQVASLTLKAALPHIPAYAQPAIDELSKMKDKNGNPVLNTVHGRSQDFYDTLTILFRAGVIAQK
ncbi:peptidoglycan recognition family protein [Paenibacillus sp. FSL W8-0186]|uniref:peptidoglycan recognition protein family protein n=1 Tax=Paenibacillus sp. FSL W8-0186 TaxID=2921709 RepID=UPI0030D1E9F4